MNQPWQDLQKWCHPPSALTVKERQEAWLFSLLARNHQSEYGKTYGFDAIKNISDYQKYVPLTDYETLTPYLKQVESGQSDVLFDGNPVAFEYTGGSSGGSKLIPYTEEGLADFRRALLPWFADVIKHHQLEEGTAYFALSPAISKAACTSAGVPIGGGDVLYLGFEAAPLFMQISAVPTWVSSLDTLPEWRLATLYWLLRADDLRLISIWSPSFLLLLLDGIQEQQEALLALLQNGGKIGSYSLEAFQAAFMRLQAFLAEGSNNYQVLWPQLCLISCWADASSKASAKVLSDQFPNVCIQGKGLLSTESVVSVPNGSGEILLAADCGFFEFRNEACQIMLAHELNAFESYEVVVTTASGLYRYRTKDRVMCLGYDVETGLPRLRFLGRLGMVSDLVGEKLTETFVLHCLEDIEGFSMLCPDVEINAYVLVSDHVQAAKTDLADKIEKRLSQNPQYAYARKLGQLAPLQVHIIERLPEGVYLEWAAKQNRRLGDIKIPALLCPSIRADGTQVSWKEIFL